MIRETADKAAVVDTEYYWQPMSTCPLSRKVQLLTTGMVAVYGQYDGKSKSWLGWAPLPRIPEELKREVPALQQINQVQSHGVTAP